MKSSILKDVKLFCNLPDEYTPFDDGIIIHINTTFALLNRSSGIGPVNGFRIEDNKATWAEFTEDIVTLGLVKDYVRLTAKVMFDPPASSTILESMNKMIDKLEFHLGVKADEEVTADE